MQAGSSKYILLVEIGGFFWWLLIRFGKTKLKEEQDHKYSARNIFFMCAVFIFIAFIKMFYFE